MKAIGVVVHHDKARAASAAEELIAKCAEHGVVATGVTDRADGIEALVGVGGDGTVLQAAALALEAGLPVAGVNVGRVGYLAEFEIDEIDRLAAAIAEDRLGIVERMTIVAEHGGASRYGVNDVVVEKVVSQRIIEIGVEIGGHRLARYRTDGIIAATPVGSTAYSLSAGGPIVEPDLEAIVLTPVAPHSLLSRSLVLSPDTEVRLTVEGSRPAQVNVDGHKAWTVEPEGVVTIRTSDLPIRFLTLGQHPFPTAVRHQFGLDHA